MRRVLTSPLLILLAGLALSFWRLDQGGQLRPQMVPDSSSYIEMMAVSNLYEALSGLRTYGYTIFLHAVAPLGDDWQWVPEIHFALWSLALMLFWLAVARFSGSHWLGLAAALPLCASCSLSILPRVGPDLLGNALALTSVSLLLLVVRDPRRIGPWIALAVACALAWLNKPVCVFLAVLAPLLGVPLRLCVTRERLRPIRLTLALAAVTLGPLMLFGLVRQQVVGHFGVGALAGYNLLGVTANFLDDEVVEALPDEERQWLAREILKGRNARGWRPMTMRSYMPHHHNQHTPNIFRIAEPKATELVLHRRGGTVGGREADPMDVPGLIGESALEIDYELGRLGKEIIAQLPLLYTRWVLSGIPHGLGKVFTCGWDRLLFGLLLISFFVAAARVVADPAMLATILPPERFARVYGLALIAAVFLLGNLLIVVPMHFLKHRYAVGATLLIPAIVGVLLFECWRVALAPGSRSAGESAR